MEKIELIGVNKSFKEEKVLKDICLTLTDNKIYGFVGRKRRFFRDPRKKWFWEIGLI